MTYEYIRSVSTLAGLILFMTLFAGVLVYVFWPANKRGFDEASLIPLNSEDLSTGGGNER
jgi:cytochrome c oxidase cbb3-type subunit IV